MTILLVELFYLSRQQVVISKTFVMETFLIRFAVYSTATAKKVSNAFISLFFYLLEWFYPISFDENSALFLLLLLLFSHEE